MKNIIIEYNQIYNEIEKFHQDFDNFHIHLALTELKIPAYHDAMDILDIEFGKAKGKPIDDIRLVMGLLIEKMEYEIKKSKYNPYTLTEKGEETLNDLIRAMGKSLEYLEKVEIDEDNEFMSDEEIDNIEFGDPLMITKNQEVRGFQE